MKYWLGRIREAFDSGFSETLCAVLICLPGFSYAEQGPEPGEPARSRAAAYVLERVECENPEEVAQLVFADNGGERRQSPHFSEPASAGRTAWTTSIR